ncbi:gamma-aminobutyric acid type B receptor subunit 1 [Trichonephila clavipes]|nr:gamma-aminobutyric acid type B receptor subunit 1 [Trichonephila clavipes]
MCNNIMLFGIICCLLCACLLGLDGQFVGETSFDHLCQVRAWLLTMGFTLSYGAMFSKIWRVHRLTTKAKSDIKRRYSWKLYIMIGVLLILDVLILSAWQIVDPLHRKLEVFPLEDPEELEDIKIEPQLEHCESDNNAIWLGIIYGYKGLLLIFGIFLAYETRSVKIKHLNDSRLVGMSIYNVVVLCLITAPVTLVISSQTDATYAFVSLAIIVCSFLSMALIFIPKVIELIRRPRERVDCRTLTDTITSREEEDRQQRLQRENEELRRQILEREDQIRQATLALQERSAMRHMASTMGGGDRVRITVGQYTDLLAPKDITNDPTSDSGFITGTSMARSSSPVPVSPFEIDSIQVSASNSNPSPAVESGALSN